MISNYFKVTFFGSTLFVFAFGQPVAACDFCDPRVTMTPELAECFLARFEKEIDAMEAASLPAQLLNLSTCEGSQSAIRGVTKLPVPIPEKEELTPTTSFLMDQDGMRCLARDLKSEDWQPEKIKTFDIRRDCDAN